MRLVHLRPFGLHIRTNDALDIPGIENGLHRLDPGEWFFDGFEVMGVEDASVDGRFVGIVLEDVPTTENELVERGERDEVLDPGRAVVGAFAEADGSELGERSDGGGESALDGLDASHERCADGSDAGDEDAELAFGGGDPGCFELVHLFQPSNNGGS